MSFASHLSTISILVLQQWQSIVAMFWMYPTEYYSVNPSIDQMPNVVESSARMRMIGTLWIRHPVRAAGL